LQKLREVSAVLFRLHFIPASFVTNVHEGFEKSQGEIFHYFGHLALRLITAFGLSDN
jgi:hypothetical protein